MILDFRITPCERREIALIYRLQQSLSVREGSGGLGANARRTVAAVVEDISLQTARTSLRFVKEPKSLTGPE